MRELPVGTVTFMFTDIEGSTRLVAALGDAYIDLHHAHQRIVRAAITAHDGHEISTEGDSFFAVFERAPDGARAAVAIERGLAAHPWPAGGAVRVRIGLHTGQGIRGGDNYLGLDVHRGARIAAAGHGGQVLLSEAAHDRTAADLPAGVSLRDLGRHRLRDVGVEHLWQLDIPGLPGEYGALRTLEAHPSNLPAEVAPLIDREAERERLTALIGSSSLVTVTGPGGIGKSRLATAVARALLPGLPDGAFHVDAAAMDSAAMLADELVRAVGARVDPGAAPADSLADHLRNRSLLLVIDTVDRVRDAGPFVAKLAAACPQVRVLVTSRTPLRVAAERELPLEPLAVAASDGSAEQIAASPAVRLFVERARAVRPDFELSAANAAAVAEICARVDGLPLAIELAAARVRMLSPDAIVARLGRRLSLLTGGAADAPDRQRTLRAAIDWSYQLLSEADGRAMAWLSVFAGPFDLDAVAGLGVAGDADDPLDVLSRLVDQSLVVADATAGEPRFRLLATIREFAAEALEAAGETAAARRAHAAWCLAFVERLRPDLQGAGDVEAVARLDMALEEVRAALDWLLGPDGDARAALEMASTLGRFWWLRGRPREGREWLERALAAASPAEETATRADALYWSGVLADEERNPAEAVTRLGESLAARRALGDERGVARTLNSMGVVARSMGDLDRAETLFRESLDAKRRLGDTRGVAATLSNLGLLAADRDDLAGARARFEEALALDRESGEGGGEAYSLNNLGAARIWSGDVLAGVVDVRQALRVFADLEDADGIAEAVEHLGEAAVALGAPAIGARCILAARAVRARAGAPLRDIDARRVLASLASAEAALPAEELDAIRAESGAFDERALVALAAMTTLPGEVREIGA